MEFLLLGTPKRMCNYLRLRRAAAAGVRGKSTIHTFCIEGRVVCAFILSATGSGNPPRHFCNVSKTYHNVDQIGNGVDEHPDPLVVGLWVDGAGRRADGQTPRALLGAHLEKVQCPKQMLRAATLWEEGVLLKQLPCFFDDEHARPKKLTEVLRLCCCCSNTA